MLLRFNIIIFLFCFSFGSISFDFSLGNAYNFNQDLHIKMESGDNINFTAHPKTNGFKNPLYYSLRIRNQFKSFDIEIELVHHKIYIDNLPGNIQKFEVSDGYNLLFLNYRKKINDHFGYRAGLGAVVLHPDIMINGKTNFVRGGGAIPKFWSDGYHWSGFSCQGSIFIERKISNKLSYNIEIKSTYSMAYVPVVGGGLDLPNKSLHLLFGLGF